MPSRVVLTPAIAFLHAGNVRRHCARYRLRPVKLGFLKVCSMAFGDTPFRDDPLKVECVRLTSSQRQSVREFAASEGMSIADAFRRLLAAGLAGLVQKTASKRSIR